MGQSRWKKRRETYVFVRFTPHLANSVINRQTHGLKVEQLLCGLENVPLKLILSSWTCCKSPK